MGGFPAAELAEAYWLGASPMLTVPEVELNLGIQRHQCRWSQCGFADIHTIAAGTYRPEMVGDVHDQLRRSGNADRIAQLMRNWRGVLPMGRSAPSILRSHVWVMRRCGCRGPCRCPGLDSRRVGTTPGSPAAGNTSSAEA